jgi:hypothetical protein
MWRAHHIFLARTPALIALPNSLGPGFATLTWIVFIFPRSWIVLPDSASGYADEPDIGEPPRLRGMSFAEARRAPIPETNELIRDLVDRGTVGLTSGLPFARKTRAREEMGTKVAAGSGKVFGRFEVVTGGPVLVVWQDDATSKMLERIQLYADRHDFPDDLPVRYLLNEGVRLPDDLAELRKMVEEQGTVLLQIDSLYNVLAPGLKLKDEDVALVIAETKHEICDKTGCTVNFTDHAPWPTEGNRGQRRSYGSVFKTAAVRWSIFLEADAKDDTKLYVEASGNNVAGFRRTPAIWDADELEIRLLDVQQVDEEAVDEDVAVHVETHPGEATSKIAATVGKRRERVESALERLKEAGRVTSKSSRELGRPGTGRYWFSHNHAESEPSSLFGTGQDGSALNSMPEGDPSHSSRPRRGDGSPDESVTQEEIERLALVAEEVLG